MAKELAQTVGGKRIALIVAILAAFAVFASLGNRLGTENAGAFVTAGPSFSGVPSSASGGDTFTAEVDATSNAASGDFNILVTSTSPLSVVADDSSCSGSGASDAQANSHNCTWDAGASETNNTAFKVAPAANCSDSETIEIQATAQDADNQSSNSDSLEITYPCVELDKTVTINGADVYNCSLPCTGVYTITIANTGDAAAENGSFVDVLDSRLLITSVSDANGGGSADADCEFDNTPFPAVKCTDIDVPVGETLTVTISFSMSSSDVPVADDDEGYTVHNFIEDPNPTALPDDIAAQALCFDEITPCLEDNDDMAVEDGSRAAFGFGGVASATIEKWSSPSSVSSVPVSAFDWIFRITNTGLVPLTNLTLTDSQLDGNTGFASADVQGFTGSLDGACVVTSGTPGSLNCDFDNATDPNLAITQLDPGETITIVVHMHTAGGPAPDGTNITNDVAFDATEIQEITAVGTLEIDNDPILSISKTAANPTVGYSATGATANSFTVNVKNNGAVPATGVVVADVLPAGLVGDASACNTTTNIAAGATFSCTVTGVFLDPTDNIAPGSVLANTASATLNADTITDTATVTAVGPIVSIVKTAASGNVNAGGTVNWTITVQNSGTSGSGPVVVTDTPQAGLTVTAVNGGGCTTGNIGTGCTIASIPAGGSTVITVTTSVAADTVDGTIFTNVACAASPNGQVAPTFHACDDASVTAKAPQITITKTNAPTLVGVNGTVTSTIVVGNSGSLPVTITSVVDTLAAGTSYIASGSTASCSAAGLVVTCGGATLNPGGSLTVTVKFNAGAAGVKTNTATTTNSFGATNPTAQASVTVVATPAGGLVHVDVDAGSEAAAHNSSNKPDNNQVLHDPGSSESQVALQDDIDDATGSLHTVCLVNATLGANDQNDIVWNIAPTPGSSATANNVTKSVKALVDTTYGDAEANCVSWRSAGVGGQTITATYTVTGDTFYWAGAQGVDIPLIKEWNDIDTTVIVEATGNVGSTIFNNTGELANWVSAASGCVRDWNISASDTNCVGKANVDGLQFSITGSKIVTGDNAGNLIAGNKSFIEYALGDHADYAGTIDGVKQTFSVSGTCGSVRLENPVTGAVIELWPGDTATVINSDKGVGFQIVPNDDADTVTDIFNADCSAGEYTQVTISSSEDVQLRSDLDTAPNETVRVVWVEAAPPAKQILLAWAGQRVVLEHDWRIDSGAPAWDVDSATIPADPAAGLTCPIDDEAFMAHYVRGAGPGNFLPSLGADIQGNDDAVVWVETNVDQVNDVNDIASGNENCISRVLYESEDPGQVDVELFIDGEEGLNLSKVAFVIYYMKFESIELSLVSQVSKPNHNAPAKTIAAAAPYEQGDYAPGNPWDASADDADDTVDWNVSKDLLVRGRVKGWFLSSNPSGRAADTSNPLNFRPANRWVMPNDWPLLAGGPDGEEVKGTAETFRPSFDLMMAPNNVGLGTGVPFLCNTPVGGCSENLSATVSGTTTTYGQLYDVVAPVEGPYSLLDLVGPNSAALSNYDPTTVRNTIIRDRDIDWWDAPMPAAIVSVEIKGSGFLKQVRKQDVYWTGTANGHEGTVATGGQDYTNPFYIVNIPDSPFIPANVAGGGFLWDSWGNDGPGGLGWGPYVFWTANYNFLGYGLATSTPAQANTNHAGGWDTSLTTTLRSELADIRVAYGALSADAVIRAEAQSIGRALVVFTDNHGEFMVTTNGDFNLTYAGCDTNVFGGGKHCSKGDLVGASTINATVDYPDFRGKHFPILSNDVKVNWTWGGYKEVTIEAGETDQFKYLVFRAVDRDGFCSQTLPGSVSLHPVLSSWDAMYKVGANDPVESVDFLIDAGEGIIVGQSGGGTINDGKQFATGLTTYSTLLNTTIKEFAPINGSTDECQAWIRVSNSLLGILNVMVTAHDDEGDIGFDRIVDFSSTDTYQLTFRWSLITWFGQDGISPTNALKGTVGTGANDIFDEVTAIYGWNQSAQSWLGFFPAGVSVPGANDLTALENGSAYWIAIKGPDPVTWTIGTNIN